MAVLLTPPFLQFFDAEGTPLAGGRVYTYEAGTTTPKATYTDQGGGVAAANPVILDAAGRATIWVDGSYKFRVTDANDALIEETDNITSYTPAGTPIISNDTKLSEQVSVKDYGALGNGATDDLQAFDDALAAHSHVFVPDGEYYLSGPVEIDSFKNLWMSYGAVLKFRAAPFDKDDFAPAWNTTYDGVRFKGFGSRMSGGRILGARTGVLLLGDSKECVSNILENVEIWDCVTGLKVDGGGSLDYPGYWNRFFNVTIERPRDVGVHLTKETSGDAANANKFFCVRVYSHGQAMSGVKYGFYCEDARYDNAFTDCEANLHPDASACFYCAENTGDLSIINFTGEALGPLPGIHLAEGAGEGAKGLITIINLRHQTAGAAMYCPSGQWNIHAINAGFQRASGEADNRNYLRGRTLLEEVRLDAEYIDSNFYDAGVSGDAYAPTMSRKKEIISASSNQCVVTVPEPSEAEGREVTFMRNNNSGGNILLKRESAGIAQGINYRLDDYGSYVTFYSNGSAYFEQAKGGTVSGVSP